MSAVSIPSPSVPTPDSLTFDEIADAVYDRLASFSDGWLAISEPGAPGRDAARQRICEALGKRGLS